MPISQEKILALQAAFPPSRRDEVARILIRARADLDHIMYVLGSGTPSTVKRATALELALEGKPVAEIAAAANLLEARVEQVLENVIASGLPALYPSFNEQVPVPSGTHAWGKIESMIRSLPPSRGVRTAAWTPAIFLDFLVNDGTLADCSVRQIDEIIKRNLDSNSKPPTFDYEDTAHQQGKPSTILSMTLFFLVGPAMIAFGAEILSASFVGGAVTVGFGIVWSLLNGSSLFKQLQERSLLRKVVALQAAKEAAISPAATAAPPPAKPASLAARDPLPPPPFNIGHVLSLPETGWQTGAITDTATALTINKLAHADKLLVADQAALDAAVAAYDDSAGTYPRTNLFTTIEVGLKNVYRGYPIHTLICTDGVWKAGFGKLAARGRIAVVNLSGFNPSHPGLEFEILHLLAGGPPARFVFLCERTTDADSVITSVLNLWSRLEPPPAVTPELHFFRIPESQDVGYSLQFNPMPRGFGWPGNIHLDREGPYTPIAARILNYLDQRS